MREEITQFLDEEESPFHIEMTGRSWCDGSYRIDRPKSGILCMEYVLAGRGTILADGRRFEPAAGDIYLLQRGEDHVYWSDRDEPWEKVWFNVRGSLVDPMLQAYGLHQVHHVPGLPVGPLFERFLEAARESGANQREIFDRCARIFHEILQAIAERVRSDPGPVHPDAHVLREHLNRNLTGKVRIGELSRLIRKSPSQTIRIFKAAFGTTPVEYLIDRRIMHARQLLLHTGLPVNEIAWRLGFADEHYFSGVFRARTGMAPGRYRADRGGLKR